MGRGNHMSILCHRVILASRAANLTGYLSPCHGYDRPGAEISAHYHPVALIRHRGVQVRRACCLYPQGLLMPAFGALTGGLDVVMLCLRRCVVGYAGLSSRQRRCVCGARRACRQLSCSHFIDFPPRNGTPFWNWTTCVNSFG